MWIGAFNGSDQPHAVDGVLDLQDWDASAGRTITLDGQWEFYPHIFLMQSEVHQDSLEEKEAKFIPVPGYWNDFLRPGENSPYGYGSYRLRILVNPGDDKTYSIRISSVRSASELFVNGRSLARSGQPATIEEQYVARNVSYSASFSANGSNVIEIVVQAANFTDSRKSGIVRSMRFGTEQAIARETNLSVAMQQIVAIAFLIHVLYALILFIMGYRDKKLLYFGLLILCAILSILIGGDDKILLYWLPINLEQSFDVIALIGVVGLYSMLQCILDQLSSFWRTRFSPGYYRLDRKTAELQPGIAFLQPHRIEQIIQHNLHTATYR